MKSPVTTHILDTAQGCPAANVPVTLSCLSQGEEWQTVAHGKTDQDGRIMNWFDRDKFEKGTYKVSFDVQSYLGAKAFFPKPEITFQVAATDEHYHIPLLLSPFGYSTYRGS